MACGILVPWPGIEPMSSPVKARSPNHWTAREFPSQQFLDKKQQQPKKNQNKTPQNIKKI